MSDDPTITRDSLDALSREHLMDIVLRQAAMIAQLQATVAQLAARVHDLEQQPPRSVAPFRRPDSQRAAAPRKPGRKPGHPGSFRRPPPVSEAITVPLPGCPQCGGAVEDVQPVTQIIEELPALTPRVVRLTTHTGHCRRCGRVRVSHPLQVSTAGGAAGTHLGPRAQALAAELQMRWHLSKRKAAHLLREVFGLRVRPGALVHIAHRLAARLRGPYEQLQADLRHAAAVYSDETGWYVGAPRHWLLVYATPRTTFYRVSATRARHVLHETLGAAFAGVLVSDCLSIYDAATPHQQKCYAHHLKALKAACQQHPQGGAGYLHEVGLLLRSAMALKGVATPEHLARLEAWAARLLSEPRGQPQEEAVRRRLAKQQDHLFTFLRHAAVEATNNLAERQLRPAVIARKLSCGNRTAAGARSWETLVSLAVTCAQRGESFKDLVQQALTLSPQPPPVR